MHILTANIFLENYAMKMILRLLIICIYTVFEIVLGELVDSRSINERTFGGPALLLVDRINMR